MQTLTFADDVLPKNFEGIEPTTAFERNILAGPVMARADAVRLGHDVFRLFRAAATIKDDPAGITRYPASRIWGLSIEKVSAYLMRVLGDEFTRETMYLTWANTMNDTRVACDELVDDATVDVALRLRRCVNSLLGSTSTVPSVRTAAWQNFQMALTVLGPIFAGEVTRADLSA